MSEAEFNTLDIVEIDRKTIKSLKLSAEKSPWDRYRFCLHKSPEHLTNEMLIVADRMAYFRPHRHPIGTDESYFIIEGNMVVFIFNDLGEVIRIIDMGDYRSNLTVLYRLCSNLWHLPVPISEKVVYHEVLTGPFRKEETVECAPWSPPESDSIAVSAYMKDLMKKYHCSNGDS